MIARSLFNLGRFDEVKQYLNGLEARGLTLDDHLTSLAERTAIKLRGKIEFASDPEWEFDVDKIWSVIDGRLILTHPRGRVGFTFPRSSTREDLSTVARVGHIGPPPSVH